MYLWKCTCSSKGLVADKVRVKVLVTEVGVDGLQIRILDILLVKVYQESRNWSTLAIITLALFHDRSFGILLAGVMRIMTAAVTFTTAGGGLPNDLSSVRLALFSVLRASSAALRAGSSLARSVSHG